MLPQANSHIPAVNCANPPYERATCQLELSRTFFTEANGNVGDDDVSCLDVDQTEDEGGQGEPAESKRRRIGKLTEQALVRLRVEISCRSRKNGALVRLVVGTGVGGLMAVIVSRLEIGVVMSSWERHYCNVSA